MTESEAIKEIESWTPALLAMGSKCTLETQSAQDMAIKALEEVQQYREIGTVEECREAVGKMQPKKVENSGERIPFEWYCPTCGNVLCDDGYKDIDIHFCEVCGQALDWSGEE